MSTTTTTELEDAAPKGRAIILSYQELLALKTAIVKIEGMLQAALALKGNVEDHERRIAALEQIQAQGIAVRSFRNTILTYLGGVASAAIGGGALLYLPKLWGG